MKNLLALGAVIAAGTTGQTFAQGGGPTLLINEIRIDQGGADNDEYFELLTSPSNFSLDGYWYVVIGDGSSGGIVESVVDLTGSTSGADGLFVAAESSFSIGTADLTTSLNFENGDNVTHLLVIGFTGVNGDDLDTDDDGVLDVTPWASVIDAISLVADPDGGDPFYGSSLGGVDVGPDGSFVPAHVFRCLTSLTDVRIGEFSTDAMSDTPGDFNGVCNGTTDAFCDPGEPNEFSMTGGMMGLTGTTSLQVNDAALVCTDVPNNFGLFAQADMVGAPVASSIGGNICLQGTIQRMNQIVVPVMNTATLPLDFTDGALVESTTTVGMTMYYQFFHRDSTFAGGGNYSNGLSVTWTL